MAPAWSGSGGSWPPHGLTADTDLEQVLEPTAPGMTGGLSAARRMARPASDGAARLPEGDLPSSPQVALSGQWLLVQQGDRVAGDVPAWERQTGLADGRAAEDDSSPWVPAPTRETQMTFLVPDFSLAQPWSLGHLGSEPAD